MKKALLTALALSLVLLTACQNPPASNPDSTDGSTESALVSDSQTASGETDPPETSLVPENAEPMLLLEGSTVTHHTALLMTVTVNAAPATRVARVAREVTADGKPQIYIDVLDEKGAVWSWRRFPGCGQVLALGDLPSVLIVMSVGKSAVPESEPYVYYSYAAYQITDTNNTSGGTEPLYKPLFVEMDIGSNPSMNGLFRPQDPYTVNRFNLKRFTQNYCELVSTRSDPDAYLVFDSYTDPTAEPRIHTPSEKIPHGITEQSDKNPPYTPEYIWGLFETK